MPAEIPPTVTGWPSAADNCCASAARTVSSVKTDRTHRNKPAAATTATTPTLISTFLDIRAPRSAGGMDRLYRLCNSDEGFACYRRHDENSYCHPAYVHRLRRRGGPGTAATRHAHRHRCRRQPAIGFRDAHRSEDDGSVSACAGGWRPARSRGLA